MSVAWVAVGVAVLGTAISAKSSKDAAKTAKEGQQQASASVDAAANRARQDIVKILPQAQQSLLVGAQGALDLIAGSIPEQQRQIRAGNIAAQQTRIQGFKGARAAFLGEPVRDQIQARDVPFEQQPIETNIAGAPQTTVLEEGLPLTTPTFRGLGTVPELPGAAQGRETAGLLEDAQRTGNENSILQLVERGVDLTGVSGISPEAIDKANIAVFGVPAAPSGGGGGSSIIDDISTGLLGLGGSVGSSLTKKLGF